MKSTISDASNFVAGIGNAIGSNNTTVMGVDGKTVLVQGVARGEGNASYSASQTVGDVISVAQGVIEFGLGGGCRRRGYCGWCCNRQQE